VSRARDPFRRRAEAVDLHLVEQYLIGPRSPILVGRPHTSQRGVGGRGRWSFGSNSSSAAPSRSIVRHPSAGAWPFTADGMARLSCQ
jgi:hypothetical protein